MLATSSGDVANCSIASSPTFNDSVKSSPIGLRVHSPGKAALAAGLTGCWGQLPASGSASQPLTLQSIKNAEGRIVRLDSLTGFAKFFCYYKMDAQGRVYLDNGKPSLNTGKLIAHVTVLGVVIFGVFKLIKKRRR